MSNITYRPEYFQDVPHAGRKLWHSTGFNVDKKTAINMVKSNFEKYVGSSATHRLVKVTEEVVGISLDVSFLESN